MEVKKNPEASLENKKWAFTFVGGVFSAALLYGAFAYISFIQPKAELVVHEEAEDEEKIFEVPPQQQTPPPPPPPPPPAPPTEIEKADDDEEIEETDIDMDMDEDAEIPDEIPEPEEEPEPEVEKIYDIVQEPAEFPGGMAGLYKYLGENIKYPSMAKEAGIQGRVFVNFVVNKDGSISDVKILRGIGGGCDEEAIRVVKKMPKWKPGKQQGKAVKQRYNLPVVFKLR